MSPRELTSLVNCSFHNNVRTFDAYGLKVLQLNNVNARLEQLVCNRQLRRIQRSVVVEPRASRFARRNHKRIILRSYRDATRRIAPINLVVKAIVRSTKTRGIDRASDRVSNEPGTRKRTNRRNNNSTTTTATKAALFGCLLIVGN